MSQSLRQLSIKSFWTYLYNTNCWIDEVLPVYVNGLRRNLKKYIKLINFKYYNVNKDLNRIKTQNYLILGS